MKKLKYLIKDGLLFLAWMAFLVLDIIDSTHKAAVVGELIVYLVMALLIGFNFGQALAKVVRDKNKEDNT